MAGKRAAGVLVTLGEDWRVMYDGERCYELQERVAIDKTHHLAKESSETHRWVFRGYYGHLPEVFKALLNKMTSSELQKLEAPGPVDLLTCLDEATKQILAAAAEIKKAAA